MQLSTKLSPLCQVLTLMAHGCFLGTEDHNQHSSCHRPAECQIRDLRELDGWWACAGGLALGRPLVVNRTQAHGAQSTEEYKVGSRHKFPMHHSTCVPVYCTHKCVYLWADAWKSHFFPRTHCLWQSLKSPGRQASGHVFRELFRLYQL